jgi:hypothetical protein
MTESLTSSAPDDSIIPRVPDDINNARIGACYNRFTRKLVPDVLAIVPSKADPDFIQFVPGAGHLLITANSSSYAAASNSIFSLDAQASGGYESPAIGVDVSIEFNMEKAQATSHQDQNLNIFCSYAFTGNRQYLLKKDPDELLGLMEDTFKEKYNAVIQATDPDEYIAKYLDFVEMFGHYCVTAVQLTAASAFRLTIASTEDDSADRQKYGGSASLSAHYGGGYGGASVAVEWAKDQQNATKNATLDCRLDNVPPTAPTADWALNLVSTFASQTLTVLTDKANQIQPPASTKPVKAPSTPNGVPDKESAGKSKVDPTANEITEELKKKIMQDDGFVGDWDGYVEQQKQLLSSITPENVVKEAAAIAEDGR